MQVDMVVANTFFDFEDYGDPVKSYIDDRFLYRLIPGFSKQYNSYIQKNEADIEDNLFSNGLGGEKKEFVGIQTVTQEIAPIDTDTIFTMKFVKDKESQAFERVVASILDVTGNLGGWFEIMEVSGGMIVGLFSGRLFLFLSAGH